MHLHIKDTPGHPLGRHGFTVQSEYSLERDGHIYRFGGLMPFFLIFLYFYILRHTVFNTRESQSLRPTPISGAAQWRNLHRRAEPGIEPGPADRTHLAAKSLEDTRPSLAVVTTHRYRCAIEKRSYTRNSLGKTLSNGLSSIN
jgi:hypothetical protein